MSAIKVLALSGILFVAGFSFVMALLGMGMIFIAETIEGVVLGAFFEGAFMYLLLQIIGELGNVR